MTDKRIQYLLLVCFHLMVVFVPVYFRFSTEELFEFNKLLAVYACTILISGLWITRMLLSGRLLFRRTPFDIPLALFLGSQVLATLFSIHPRTSWFGYYTRFHGGLLSYLTYTLLFYAAVNTLEKKHLKPLLLSALGSAALVATYGILEHFGHSLSCLLITNGASFDVSCWIQDVQSRVFATFGQPNWLAAYLITLWPIAAWFVVSKKSTTTAKMFGLLVWSLLTTALLYTKSRSGVLGLGVGVLTIVGLRTVSSIISNRQLSTQTRSVFAWFKEKQLAVYGLLIQLLIILVIGTPFNTSIFSAFGPLTKPSVEPAAQRQPVDRLEAGGTDSGEIRKIVWSGAVAVWQRYPIFGSGVETFAYSYYRDRPAAHNQVSEWDFLYNKAHNEVLNFFATTGTVGGVSYLLLVGWLFMLVWKISVSSKFSADEQLLAICMSGGIAALFVSNFFGFSTVMVTLLWFLFQAFTSILMSEKQPDTTHSLDLSRKQVISSAQWFGIGLTWFSAVIALLLVYRMYAADAAFAEGKSLLSAGEFISGSQQLQRAILLSPNEALYYDELAHHMAKTAVDLAASNQATSASELASTAVLLSDTALTLNPVHLNFFKTRARVFITLAQLKPDLLRNAREALLAALERSPTDAKLVYNLALVEMGLGNEVASLEKLQQAVELKPNYAVARLELAKAYLSSNATPAAQLELEYILQYLNPGDTQTQDLLDQIATGAATPTINK